MNGLTAISAIFGIGAASVAFPVWSGMFAGQAGAIVQAEPGAVVSQELPGLSTADLRGCVGNFSKDDCGGEIHPGSIKYYGCPTTDCRTITMRDAVYVTTLTSSGGLCGIDCLARCDDHGDGTDGTLTLKFDYTLRADSCCPYRGFWEGEWEYATNDGRVFAGTAHGTLGVGTNRAAACFDADDACERCYDVQFTGEYWFIAMEGSYTGRDDRGNELRFTTDSTWFVKEGGAGGVFEDVFRVQGRNDGAFMLRCN